jgi:hypothetical protein
MGYYVRALMWKKSVPNWKLQFVSYKSCDVLNSNAQKLKKEWDVDPDRWHALGIHKLMTIEEAKVRAKQLNAQDYLRGQEERIKKIELQDAELRKRFDSVLPEEFVAEFEKRFIKARDSETIAGKRKTSRARVTWKAAQKLIVAVQIDPSEWFYYNNEIYDYFFQKKYSLRYCHSILNLVNRWGYYISRKLAKPFMAIVRPRGYERQRLIEAYYGKTKYVRRPSAQLTPEHLMEISLKMNQPNFNWLFLSVWLGLRPQEIDNLHDKSLWKLEIPIKGRKILWVFQTKIVALPHHLQCLHLLNWQRLVFFKWQALA